MAEPNDLPPGGGGTARPGDAIGGQPKHKKEKKKYPVGTTKKKGSRVERFRKESGVALFRQRR